LTTVVTGGAGFIGSHVAEHFAKYGDVIVCDNLSRTSMLGKMEGVRSYNWDYLSREYPKVRCHRIDLRDFRSLRETAKGADTIVHAAGQVAVTTSVVDPRTDFEINALGTFNVLEVARLNDTSVVFCSTNKVYGENVNSIPIREEQSRYSYADPSFSKGIPEALSIDHTGHSPYGSSKLAADIYAQDYASTYGLKTGVFRMSCIYGERQFGVEDQGWLAWFVIATLTGRSIRVFGNGKQVRDVLYVKDLVDAFDRFVRSNIKHEVFNMGGGPENTLSLLELLDQLRGLAGKQPKVTFRDWRPSDQRVYVSAIEKAQKMLGWKPRVSPREGVKLMVDWIQRNIGLFSMDTAN
jgi:CDP-paratose 2-epimerase